ncbi:MAG: leucine-rich repeat protein, partial [Clostridia bacterium]|nr:leucine-rich repeat protein [Clostridia bacterium]
MREKVKKIISVLLCLTLLAGVGIETIASASTYGDFEYEVQDGTAVIKECNKNAAGGIVIPEAINGYPVTSIDGSAFWQCTKITSVTIPGSVKTIGAHAFYGCSALTSLIIKNGVSVISQDAFQDCTSLSAISLPDSVTTIGWDAFQNTKYYNTASNWVHNVLYIGNHLIKANELSGSYEIKPGTVSIAYEAFAYDRNLTGITFPEGLKSIGQGAFDHCSGLTSVHIPDSVETISPHAFSACSGLTDLSIGNSVTTIGAEAFAGCSGLTDIVIPNSVKAIDYYAFANCENLSTVEIPEQVTIIGYGVFSECPKLTSITVAPGNSAFKTAGNCLIDIANKTLIQGCNSSSIPDDGSVVTIGQSAFSGCAGLSSLTIPGCIKTIEAFAFQDCTGLETLVVGNGVQHIGNSAFYGCGKLAAISLPDSLISVGNYAFGETAYYNNPSNWENDVLYIGNCLIKANETLSGEYTVKPSTTCIADYAFSFSKLAAISIPNSITRINKDTFHGCLELTSIFLPKTINYIGLNAFNATDLKEVYYEGDAQDRLDIQFEPGHDYGYDMLNEATWYYNSTALGDQGTISNFTLTYDANGGTGAPSNQIGCGNVTISYTRPVRSGYTFSGWSENSAATAAQFQPGAVFSLVNDTTLYAVWEKISVPDNPTASAKIRVRSDSVFKNTKVTVVAKATGVPDGYVLAIYDGGNDPVATGSRDSVRYTFREEVSSAKTLTVKVIDANGNVQKDANGKDLSEKIEITVKTGFFNAIIAFFRKL